MSVFYGKMSVFMETFHAKKISVSIFRNYGKISVLQKKDVYNIGPRKTNIDMVLCGVTHDTTFCSVKTKPSAVVDRR